MWGPRKKLSLAILLLFIVSCFLSCSKNSSGGDVDDDDDSDTTPPQAITDLRQVLVNTNSATLEWTAPGDDGNTGVAYQYDFRASQATITAANFDSAYRVDSINAPLPAGMIQSFKVETLTPGESYYFAIKTRDEAGNWSGISNCVGVTCLTDQVVVFPDSILERNVRETIDLPTGDIHISDLQDMIDLVAADQGIENLSGLEYCINIVFLHLSGNEISDLAPLQTMSTLWALTLFNNNISDLTPLAGLTNLGQLSIGNNPISDISPLANLGNLEWLRLNNTEVMDYSPIYELPLLRELDISGNGLADIAFIFNFTQVKVLVMSSNGASDLTPLASLTGLEELYCLFNQAVDLSPLSGLTNIHLLDLRYNQIADILPLVNNSGISSGDTLYLQNNPLSAQSIDDYIPILEVRGVTVNH
ncbi:MAG: leucine-rich repeat domain-containing protein [Candidatus Zixiibacteriota bacterium]